MNVFSTNSSELWVLKNDLCRCCHAEGTFESLEVPINDFGESAVFSNMLESIGIEIKPMPGYLGRATFKICFACIAQLRSAINFKEQVISCENNFQMLCEKNLIIVPEENKVKLEKFDDEGDFTDSPETGPGDGESYIILDVIKNGIKTENIDEEITTQKPQTRRRYQSRKSAAEPKKPIVQAESQTETENSAKKIDEKEIKEENNKLKYLNMLKKLVKKETVKKTATKPKKSAVKSETTATNKPKARKRTSPKEAEKSPKNPGSWMEDMIEQNGVYRCANCDEFEGEMIEVQRHLIKKHHKFACMKCRVKFNEGFERDKHMIEVHGVLQKTTNSNPATYTGAWTRAVIEENGLYRCNFDAHAGSRRPAVNCDQIQHNNKEVILHHLATTHYKFRCTKCPERFRSRPGKHRHLLTEHNIDKTIKIKINCGSCDKVFTNRRQYKNHLNSYHKLGELRKCDKCDYETYSQVSWSKHWLNHTDVKPFSCRFCEKTFKRTKTRTFHERIHTREGLKKCPYCEQSFVQRTSVKYHVLKHHPGEKI